MTDTFDYHKSILPFLFTRRTLGRPDIRVELDLCNLGSTSCNSLSLPERPLVVLGYTGVRRVLGPLFLWLELAQVGNLSLTQLSLFPGHLIALIFQKG
jgi:hypothetical protein